MKIEIVSFTGNSGLTDYAVSLARAITSHAQTRLVTAFTLSEKFNHMGFEIDRVFRRSRQYPVDIVKFFVGILKRKPDWVLLQGPIKFPFFDGVMIRLLRLFEINTAITVHDVLPHYPRWWSEAEYGFYYRSFDKVIAHSEVARQSLIKNLGITRDILVVPHGIYDIFNLTNISQADARQKIKGLAADDFVILFFGNLEPRKGLMEFLAMAKASTEPKLKFLIAGNNDLFKHGQTLVNELNAGRDYPNIIIHDKRIEFEDVENYFSACNVVALPYLEGTTSGVLKLALAFGKPVVATRVGDLPEQIPTGAGVIVENDTNLTQSLNTAIAQIKSYYDQYVNAMAAASHNAQWSDIADRIVLFLKSK